MKGDPERLGQVVTNLLSNAIQYNHPGGQVVVSVATDEQSVIIVVADTGVGIPESDLPLVFDRFHRVDAARSRESGGSGLGLAICRSIVEAHGGTITVASASTVVTIHGGDSAGATREGPRALTQRIFVADLCETGRLALPTGVTDRGPSSPRKRVNRKRDCSR